MGRATPRLATFRFLSTEDNYAASTETKPGRRRSRQAMRRPYKYWDCLHVHCMRDACQSRPVFIYTFAGWAGCTLFPTRETVEATSFTEEGVRSKHFD